MKPIRLRIFARVVMGCQMIDYVVYSRKRQQKWCLSIKLHGGGADAEQYDRRMVADALKYLRADWRKGLLGDDWQRRSAMRRMRILQEELRRRHIW